METTPTVSKFEHDFHQPTTTVMRMSYSTRRASSRRVVLLGIGAVVVGAFYAASWVPWNTGPRYGAGLKYEETIGSNSTRGGWDFDWNSITPSPELTYYSCFSGYQCARLSIPLDHLDPANTARAHIAIVKLPSTIPESNNSWGGPILLNPGGPGASGVALVLQAGHAIQNVVGGKYSIIGFDPRGVNNTIPQISCFKSRLERKVWHAKSGGRVLNSTGGSDIDSQLVELGEVYARAAILAKRCNEANKESIDYVGTTSTARDMRIITAAEWEGKLDESGNPRRKGLQYWGFSYGSVLGITYAAMFPDDVERIVVDGLINIPDYFNLGWSTNLQDTEAVMDSFYEYCSLAGPLRCAFHTGKTPQDIKARLERLLDTVKRNPIPAVLVGDVAAMLNGVGDLQPDLITYSDLKNVIFIALYQPLMRFPVLAHVLAAVEAREPTALSDYRGMFDIKPLITCSATPSPGPGPSPAVPPDDLHAREATPAILCSDGTPLSSKVTPRDFLPYISRLREQSATSGDVWAQIRLSCVGWQGQAKEKPPKVLTLPNAPPPSERLKPRNAVLFLNTDRDPATPLRNAFFMKDWFADGKVEVLVQEGVGHCSVNSPSECAAAKVRAYFEEGRMSQGKKEERCGMETRPFLDGVKGGVNLDGEGMIGSLAAVGRVVAGLGGVGAAWAQ